MTDQTNPKRHPLSDIQNVQHDSVANASTVSSQAAQKAKTHGLPVHRDQTLIQKATLSQSKIPKTPRPRVAKSSGAIVAKSAPKASESNPAEHQPKPRSTTKPSTSKVGNRSAIPPKNSVEPAAPRLSSKPKTYSGISRNSARQRPGLSGNSGEVLDPQMRRRTTDTKLNFAAPGVRSRMSSTVTRDYAGNPAIQEAEALMRMRVDVESSKHEFLFNQVAELSKKIESMQSTKSSDGNSVEFKRLAADNAILQYSKQELERQLKEARTELTAARDQFEEARQEQARMSMIQENNQAKLGHLTKLEEELQELRIVADRVYKAESRVAKMSELERESESNRHALDNARCELDERTKTCRQVKRELETSRSEFEESRREFNNVTRDRDEARKLVARLELSGNDKDSQITALSDAVKAQEARFARVAADKIALNVQLDSSREETQKVREELLAMTGERDLLAKENVELQAQAREDAKHRRKLHNMIQELKGNIRVFCRVRPPTEKENEVQQSPLFEYNEKGQGIVARAPSNPGDTSIANAGKIYDFKFDKVFDPASSQAGVFEEISELVQSALDGYRVCIFAYGQTGSGKTYTMLGQPGTTGTNSDAGLGMIPRAVRQVFESAKAMERDDWSFTLQACFLEIYNESVRDLLDPNSVGSSTGNGNATTGGRTGNNGSKDFRITFDTDTKLCTVSDVTVVDVRDENQLQRLIERSMRNRTTAATKANDRSSRSHSVFRLRIIGRNSVTGQQLDGLLNLIDLAGSERLAHSKAEGERLRETRNINRSLSALGDVISALSNREKHVPFRNSKLTHLLQDSLGGDCKTLMFVNVSHATESFGESLCSLRFAHKVNNCHVGTARRTAKIDLKTA